MSKKKTTKNNKNFYENGRIFLCKPIAIFTSFCYYIKAFRTGADFPHVAAVKKAAWRKG